MFNRKSSASFFKPVAVFILVILVSGLVWSWGGRPHRTMTKAALDALPQWEKEIWKSQIPQIIEEYCLIPDFYLRRPDLAGYAILDVYDVEFSDYTYTVTKPYVIRNGHYHLPDKQRENFTLYEHFIGKIISSLEDERIDDAAKFAGVLLHVIEDFSAPSHTIQGDNQFMLFKQFMPPPEKFKYSRFHSLIESGDVTVDISARSPVLMGTSAAEVAFRLHERMNEAIVRARGKVVPIIQAIYDEDAQGVRENNSQMAVIGAEIAADMLHSTFSIAYDRLDPAQEEALRTAPLADLIPLETIYLAWRQPRLFRPIYGGAPTNGVILDKKGKPLPLALRFEENGSMVEKPVDSGIAAGTRRSMVPEPCVLSYIIPEGVFSRFAAVIGLHPQLAEEGGVIFQIRNGEEVLFDSGPVTREDPARAISVPLGRAGEFSLVTFSGSKDHPDNYPVWGNPRLVK